MPHLDGVNELVVVASKPMLGIPIEALVDASGACLSERFAISYVPSATIHAWLAERSAGRGSHGIHSALLVGDPDLGQLVREAPGSPYLAPEGQDSAPPLGSRPG